MAIPSPNEAAAKWSRNLKAAKPSIIAGVNAVTSSPMEKAAQKADQYVAGVQAAAESGKWQAGLRSRSLGDWKTSMTGKGMQRLESGVQAAEPKVLAFQSEFLPFVAQVQQAVNAMPDNTESDRDQKMLENARRLRQFKRTNRTQGY